MKKYIKLLAISAIGALVFAGCAGDDVTMEYKIENKQGISRIKTDIDKPILTVKGYWDETYNNKCAFAYRALFLAEAAKKEGYDYFSINDLFNSISNIGGLAITSPEALDRYCYPKNFADKTGLESKKCNETSPIAHVNRAILLKQPSYLYPAWNVNRTINQLRPIVKECTNWKEMLPKSYSANDDANLNRAMSNLIKR